MRANLGTLRLTKGTQTGQQVSQPERNKEIGIMSPYYFQMRTPAGRRGFAPRTMRAPGSIGTAKGSEA